MVEVELRSIKKVIVNEVFEHTFKNLVKLRIVGLPSESVARPLFWAEGVLFTRTSMPPTEEVIKRQLEGIIHISAIGWALMPNYRKSIRLEGVTIPVMDVSDNPTICKIIREIKKTKKEI